MMSVRRVSISVDEGWLQQLADNGEISIDRLGRVQGLSLYLERLRRKAEGVPA